MTPIIQTIIVAILGSFLAVPILLWQINRERWLAEVRRNESLKAQIRAYQLMAQEFGRPFKEAQIEQYNPEKP